MAFLELMTVKEAAEFLDTTTNSLNVWLSKNPDIRDALTRKARGRRFFLKSELEKYIMNNGVITK